MYKCVFFFEKNYIHTYMNIKESHTITLEDDETLSKIYIFEHPKGFKKNKNGPRSNKSQQP